MHRSRISRLRISCSSPLHDTIPVIARMPLSISQEVLRPIEVGKYMHCRRAEVGPTLQALSDMVQAVVDVVSCGCVPCAFMVLLWCAGPMIMFCSSVNMAVVMCAVIVLVELHPHSVEAV